MRLHTLQLGTRPHLRIIENQFIVALLAQKYTNADLKICQYL